MIASLAALIIASPPWTWRQILATPAIGGRLTAMAVDPRDPDRIYVGTEEGTILRSEDGGATWRESDPSPRVVRDRNLGLPQPGLPELGAEQEPDFQIFIDPPFNDVAFRPSLFFPTLFFSLRPDFVFAGFLPPGEDPPEDLLANVVASRRGATNPVKRIAICPEAYFSLLVATRREVYGSADEGLTYVRMFALPGAATIDHVVCSRRDGRRVVVAASTGLFLSEDGGLSFDEELSGWPGQAATAVGFGPPPKGKKRESIVMATDDVLWIGDPMDGRPFEDVYPDYDNAATAPWLSIWWVATSPKGQIWAATEDGARASADGGRSWSVPARDFLGRQAIWQVEIGENERGGERVVVLVGGASTVPDSEQPLSTEDWVYASDDGGENWFPFFSGIDRRSFYMVASAPAPDGIGTAWWVSTSGGVWASHAPSATRRFADPEAQAWAKERLAKNPPLHVVMDAILDRTRLSQDRVEAIWSAITTSFWIPEINAEARWSVEDGPARNERSGDQFNLASRLADPLREESFTFFVNARWDVYWTNLAVERFTEPRLELYELGRQVGFVAEDAWHERVLLLRRVLAGPRDFVELDTHKTRIAALEAVLETWLRHPLEDLR